MQPILAILAILTVLAVIWAFFESRRPRQELSAGMPEVAPDERSQEEAMRDALLASGQVKAKEWDAVRGEILFIHDGLGEDELGRMIVRAGGTESWTNPRPAFDEETAGGVVIESEEYWVPLTAREWFRTALEAQGLLGSVEPLGTFYAPGPFDAYRVRG